MTSYERKAELPPGSEKHAMGLLLTHPAGFREIHETRWIRNVYFDTTELASYWDNVAGVGKRVKIRLRYYGEAKGSVRPQLELKKKRDQVREKEVIPLTEVTLGQDPVAALLETTLAAELPGAARALLLGSTPVLCNHYLRRYFLSADGKLRATVDWKLGFSRVYSEGRYGPQLEAPHAVFELKYAVQDDDLARKALQAFPFRLSKHSKYARGIELLYGLAPS